MRLPAMIVLLGVSAASQAITFGQLDTFTSGFQDWLGSSPTLAMGGPSGATDQYLKLQSGPGFSPKLSARNQVQWLGNFASAGVSHVTVDFANFSASQIELRLALFGAGGREFTSAASTAIIADGLWHSYTFSLAESALTSVGTNSNYSGMITGVTNFQFRHNPGSATGSGTLPNFTGIMGMDNVHAVPEPASLLAVCLGGLIIKRRRASAP